MHLILDALAVNLHDNLFVSIAKKNHFTCPAGKDVILRCHHHVKGTQQEVVRDVG